jgi:hypothetical protein
MGAWAGVKSIYRALVALGDAAGVGRTLPTPQPAPPMPGATSRKVPGGSGAVTDYKVMGPSTISLRVFRDALIHRVSPAVVDMENKHISTDLADELYEIATAWGVNPAVALAFFVHESSAGTQGVAKTTKNWGNLRSGAASRTNIGDFAVYSAWAVGLDDFCRLVTGPLYAGDGLDTVSKVTPRYAPSADSNDPAAYAHAVNAQVAVWEAMG